MGDISYPSPIRVKSAPSQPMVKEESHPDELRLLQSKFKIDVQKSSSRGTSQQVQHGQTLNMDPNGYHRRDQNQDDKGTE